MSAAYIGTIFLVRSLQSIFKMVNIAAEHVAARLQEDSVILTLNMLLTSIARGMGH